MRPKILFVGMIDSVHAAKWIQLVSDEGWDLHFYPIYEANPEGNLRNITIHRPAIVFNIKKAIYNLYEKYILRNNCRKISHNQSIKYQNLSLIPVPDILIKIFEYFYRIGFARGKIGAKFSYGPLNLVEVIKKIKPDLIHSMEFQHSSYCALAAKELMGNKIFPKWLITNWGSDIYYYQRFPEHLREIKKLLTSANFYSCECKRDVDLAIGLGMTAVAMEVFPNTGGFNLARIQELRNQTKPSNRKKIMVKGYEHFAGRALNALNALLMCRELLNGYEVLVFSASKEIYSKVEEMQKFHKIDIKILNYQTHESMLKHFSEARIYIGVSISDAISTSMLEAMAVGTFPIQTNTSCCEEWIADGETGFIIEPDNITSIAEKIKISLIDDSKVNRASELNWLTVKLRLDQNILRAKEIDMYNKILKK